MAERRPERPLEHQSSEPVRMALGASSVSFQVSRLTDRTARAWGQGCLRRSWLCGPFLRIGMAARARGSPTARAPTGRVGVRPRLVGFWPHNFDDCRSLLTIIVVHPLFCQVSQGETRRSDYKCYSFALGSRAEASDALLRSFQGPEAADIGRGHLPACCGATGRPAESPCSAGGIMFERRPVAQ